ncbi:hypothetical protein G9C85_05010 [Halorubellus sp. JP-L1]|uniref:BGTF surface domain-containing protein n=1 Tax=Halorubellus sp. JP-L1 TaxID=2715753 RepID=UPI00140C87E3|nr:BGTF surface domain-containing protein [Halorubellus sp. JP-L1]NHN40996.1 hypothetical protein [Halorubellus sp. JP-L1]
MTRSARGGVAVALAALAVLSLAAPTAVGANGAGSAGSGAADLGGTVEAADASPVADGVADPTLSVPDAANRSRNLTASVSLPADANGSRTFRVTLDPVAGESVAARSVTLAPGESATVDLGACHRAQSYVVRLATPDGDVLVAAQTEVHQANPLVALAEDSREMFAETVSRSETLRVDARLHRCVDRAAFSLRPDDGGDSGPLWRASAVDEDDDGRVAFAWDVDAAADTALVAADGTELSAGVAVDRPVPYGAYELETTTGDGEDGRSGRVTVSFADPDASVYTADGRLSATEAIDAARDGDPVRGEYAAEVVADDWVVLRVDVDGTLDSLPADASLLAPARHENATVRARGVRGGVHGDPAPVDLANATRRFDADAGTLWYAYRADSDQDRTRFEYVALGESWNATASAEVVAVDAVTLDLDSDGRLSPEHVSLDGHTPLPDGTALSVGVRVDGRAVATDEVTVSDGRFEAALDLSGVANGTNATVVVREDGETVHEQAVTVVAEPAFTLRGVRIPDGIAADEPVPVRAFVLNRGTIAGNATVAVTLGNVTRERTESVPAGEDAIVEVRFPASDVPDDEAAVVVSMGETRVERTVEFDEAQPTPPTTGSPTTTPTPTGSEPWPTLADGERRPASDPLPGFGPVAALASLAAALAIVARRISPGAGASADADGD